MLGEGTRRLQPKRYLSQRKGIACIKYVTYKDVGAKHDGMSSREAGRTLRDMRRSSTSHASAQTRTRAQSKSQRAWEPVVSSWSKNEIIPVSARRIRAPFLKRSARPFSQTILKEPEIRQCP